MKALPSEPDLWDTKQGLIESLAFSTQELNVLLNCIATVANTAVLQILQMLQDFFFKYSFWCTNFAATWQFIHKQLQSTAVSPLFIKAVSMKWLFTKDMPVKKFKDLFKLDCVV